MSAKTRSAASSRKSSFAGTPNREGGRGFSDIMSAQRPKKSGQFIGTIDCGTTSTRFIVFDEYAKIITEHQMEFKQYYPHPGWHEHEPYDLVDSMNECITQAIEKMEFMGFSASDIKCIGITNQRETVVCWDKKTGKPLCKTVVWDDARTVTTVREFQKKLDEEGLPFGEGEEEVSSSFFSENISVKPLAEKLKQGLGLSDDPVKNKEIKDKLEDLQEDLPTPTVLTDVAISGEKRRKKGKEALVDM